MLEQKEISIIPPTEKHDKHIRVEEKQLNVAAYCRVSTRFEQQENSYEAQVKYYTEKITANPKWNPVGIYADQGKTATGTKNRDSFNDMITDCYAGKIDMILTKSISRFARNTVDFLKVIRELKSRHIHIIFEKENIDTMDSTSELLITILSSQAQEESRNLSENTRWGIVRRFEQGIVHVNHTKFLGYTKNAEGKLVIVPQEAEVIRKIFGLYLQGLGISKIARILEEQGIKTATGNLKWHSSTIHKMLKCEKYIGDAMLQKTYTIDFLSKKRVINDGVAKRYYIKNNHKPIISKEQYYQVQEELKRRKNKITKGTRYSSKYAFSGLITCLECGSKYTRVTWYNKQHNTIVWRCKRRLKSGTTQCSNASSVKETALLNTLSKVLNTIVAIEIQTASSLYLQSKASIVSLFNGTEINTETIGKVKLNIIIRSIDVMEKEQIRIHFKSGLIVDQTLL
ncbi:recombinase family protein [Robinsoniella peoriensis]|uniref:recombinase family protein n=1 Tax=Robinsoniella peoriensis TaxID=180332 RepID=UPI003634629C